MSVTEHIRVSASEKLKPVRTFREMVELDQEQSEDHDHYAVYLKDLATEAIVRVRTPVHFLDEDRCPILDENGKPKARSPFDATLDVWAAHGAHEYDLWTTQRGPKVVVTPQMLMGHIQAVESLQRGEQSQGDA